MDVESGEWVLYYGLLPEVVYLDPGEFLSFTYDTANTEPDPEGLYRASLQYVDGLYPIITAMLETLSRELEQCGLHIVEQYADVSGRTYAAGDVFAVVVQKK